MPVWTGDDGEGGPVLLHYLLLRRAKGCFVCWSLEDNDDDAKRRRASWGSNTGVDTTTPSRTKEENLSTGEGGQRGD